MSKKDKRKLAEEKALDSGLLKENVDSRTMWEEASIFIERCLEESETDIAKAYLKELIDLYDEGHTIMESADLDNTDHIFHQNRKFRNRAQNTRNDISNGNFKSAIKRLHPR